MDPARTLNLLGELCPMTWVRTKLALEETAPGGVLEVWLDEGEPATSVPQSAAAAGFEVLSEEPGPEGGVAVCLKKPLR